MKQEFAKTANSNSCSNFKQPLLDKVMVYNPGAVKQVTTTGSLSFEF
jgi:hypothetical protein